MDETQKGNETTEQTSFDVEAAPVEAAEAPYTNDTDFESAPLGALDDNQETAEDADTNARETYAADHDADEGQAAGGIGAAVTRRIMASLKIPEEEYAMVCTANRTTAFRLLAESYSFQPGKQLLPVYDYESEAVGAMADSARRRGAEVTSASFAWPSMRIHGTDLRKRLARGCRRGAGRGLFVFPLASRMTGARYPYLWMSAAHEQGWHVALDACALGTKDLDTFGLSLIRPDFIVCNFFKVFGENPSGFAGLFVKKSSLAALERSVIARSIGIVSIVPARRWSLHDGYSTELEHSRSFPKLAADPALDDADVETTSSFSGPLSSTAITRSRTLQSDAAENGDAHAHAPEIREVGSTAENGFYSEEPRAEETERLAKEEQDGEGRESVMEVECRGLDHADALGLIAIGNRLRCISNWLVVALQKLRHPHADNGHPLVRLYGPRVKFDRGPSLAFNVFDWKGERVSPLLVQKLADRHNISLTCGFLCNIWFSDKHEAERALVLEHRVAGDPVAALRRRRRRRQQRPSDVDDPAGGQDGGGRRGVQAQGGPAGPVRRQLPVRRVARAGVRARRGRKGAARESGGVRAGRRPRGAAAGRGQPGDGLRGACRVARELAEGSGGAPPVRDHALHAT